MFERIEPEVSKENDILIYKHFPSHCDLKIKTGSKLPNEFWYLRILSHFQTHFRY